MKRLFILGFSAALLAGGVSSCKKTSRGKMSNEWTVSKMTSEYSSVSSGGSTSTESMSIDGASGTSTDVSNWGGTSTTTNKTIAVKSYDYTINKDGSYTIKSEMVWTENADGGVTYVDTQNNEVSGTWTFLGKNKTGEFKKNELVAFYATSAKSSVTSTVTANGTSTSSTSSSSNTYSGHDYATIYKVVESKSKELQLSLEYEDKSSDTDGNGDVSTSTYKSSESITLVQK